MTEGEKDKFIDDYLEHEGLQLDPMAIEYNQWLRQTMKIILNSLWGKFGQRGRRNQSKICWNLDSFLTMYLIRLTTSLIALDHFCAPARLAKISRLISTDSLSRPKWKLFTIDLLFSVPTVPYRHGWIVDRTILVVDQLWQIRDPIKTANAQIPAHQISEGSIESFDDASHLFVANLARKVLHMIEQFADKGIEEFGPWIGGEAFGDIVESQVLCVWLWYLVL